LHDGFQKNSLVHENPTTCRDLKLVSAFMNVNGRRGGNNCWDYGTIDFGITWNYLELFFEFLQNLHKIPLEFLELLWNSWNSIGITAR
jgi:hypothetical protein